MLPGAPSVPGRVRIGTWNVSGWSLHRAGVIVEDVGADVLAVQETHLSPVMLERSMAAAHRHHGLRLHHGRPVPPSEGGLFGRRCGVGFVAAPGVALVPAPPRGAPWRMLHAMYRLHGVQIPPRPGLPLGVLLLSVYAPVAARGQQLERARYALAMAQLTPELDMQMPTLLLGDFNGSAFPHRDYLAGGAHARPACPLLVDLLGPGGAWVDVQATLTEGEMEWTFRNRDSEGHEAASRIDLILANQAALRLIQSVEVLSAIQFGGHSPVVVTLRQCSALALQLQQHRPSLPLLQLPSGVLCLKAISPLGSSPISLCVI